MRVHRLTSTQVIPVDSAVAWEFFSSPRNLSLMTPPWLNLVPTSEVPGAMHPGLIVTYTVRPVLGIPVTWVTEITSVIDGTLFVDEQRAGPYRFWHHQHHFRAVPGGTEVTDIVHYALPLGLLGELAAGRMVKRRVRELFAYRRRALIRLFGAAPHAQEEKPAAANSGEDLAAQASR